MFNRAQTNSALTLIELMVVIAIVGLILTVSVPLYKTMTNKVNLSQMVNKLGSFKLSQTDAYTANSTWLNSINNATAPQSVSDSFFPNAVSFRYNTDGNKAWWGYQLSSAYGSGWIFMLLIANTDGSFETHCGSLSTSCTFGSCDSSAYYPASCSETGLSAEFTLSDS